EGGRNLVGYATTKSFSELDGISMYQNTKNIHKGNSTPSTSKLGDNKDVEQETVTSKKLQKDSIIMEEVVKIINDQRKEKKQEIELIPYQRYVAPPIFSSEKELMNMIFRKCEEEMEWEATEIQITEEGVREW
ncbi:11162_t:CDS:2, partial [Rhizophagus irregularis]